MPEGCGKFSWIALSNKRQQAYAVGNVWKELQILFLSHVYFFRSVLNRIAELACVMSPFGVISCKPIKIFIDSFANERI